MCPEIPSRSRPLPFMTFKAPWIVAAAFGHDGMSHALRPPFRGGTARTPPLIVACLAATWLIWGSTYLAIKWALVSFPPFFQMGTRFVAAGLCCWAPGDAWRGARWPDRRAVVQRRRAGRADARRRLRRHRGGADQRQLGPGGGLHRRRAGAGGADAVCPTACAPGRLEAAGIGLGLLGVLCCSCAARVSRRRPAGWWPWLVACHLDAGQRVGAARPARRAARWRWPPGAMGYASQMLAGGCC
jgi:hypothetical protein